jgi:hypothetical protein
MKLVAANTDVSAIVLACPPDELRATICPAAKQKGEEAGAGAPRIKVVLLSG